MVGGKGLRVDNVYVSLGELAITAFLRTLTPPHLLDLVAPERKGQHVRVFEHVTSKGHGQIKVQTKISWSVCAVQPLHDVDLLVDLALLGKAIQRLHRPGLDRGETVQLERLAESVKYELFDDPGFRRVLRKAGQRLRATHATPWRVLPGSAGTGCPPAPAPWSSAGRARGVRRQCPATAAPWYAGSPACRPGFRLASQFCRSSRRTRRRRRRSPSRSEGSLHRPFGTSSSQGCVLVRGLPESRVPQRPLRCRRSALGHHPAP